MNNLERAAQLWCDERVSDRVMDVEFGHVIKEALDDAEQRGMERAAGIMLRWKAKDPAGDRGLIYLNQCFDLINDEIRLAAKVDSKKGENE